ncbi:phosphotransferase family protein [Nocardioides zeae]|uniref:Phosphotransferase family protein n=1 Tax=Nocardioides imazamoxiresistens TaxID=3231893 RepID=A0ABU3PVL9_9ACTN|nr:phosphotransferase family protein [Nocardioides zeae]MDT9593273.1 phosphotransferase family protein [Nocardioides zeae]
MTSPLTEDELATVARVMREAGAEVAGALSATVLAGGRSNLTVRLEDADGGRWVLRMPPRTGRTPSAHDVVREHRITRGLGATDVPVPTAVVACEDETLLGGAFAVSAFADGTCVQSREQLDALDAPTLSAVVDELVTVLARLHEVDVAACGLDTLGRPSGYADRQLRRWSGQWALVGDPTLSALEAEVRQRLEATRPVRQDAAAVVHGDYRIDNTLLDLGPGSARVTAVVDWELCTLGDPVADVAMMCAYRDPAFDLVIGSATAWASPRLPSPDGLAAAYCDAGGVELADWDFHLALARYKIAVIAAGIAHRRAAGGSTDPGTALAHTAVRPFLEAALAPPG